MYICPFMCTISHVHGIAAKTVIVHNILCMKKIIYKGLLITTNASINLTKSASTDLTVKSDSVLTNPIGKDGVRSWSM